MTTVFWKTIEPELTTVRVDNRGLGEDCVRLLHDLISGKTVAPGIKRIPAELVIRGST
ncbi:MAG: substrate-binding domain-containing protein [Clostridiaceae bacterium]|nr:substrate-binding domain-containing protein [Clostridiaceae bacterium]